MTLEQELAVVGYFQTSERLASSEGSMSTYDQFAWVIERGDSSTPIYWAGYLSWGDGRWSNDHLDAVRFVRKIDAERTIAGMTQPNHRVVEHVWIAQAEPKGRCTSKCPCPGSCVREEGHEGTHAFAPAAAYGWWWWGG
jgi:hypothetical protein